jgi:protein-S-isoprenylcysteine O-methyltransferase Ste14
VARRAVSILVTLAVWQGALVLAAGRWDWPRAWLYLAVSAGLLLVNVVVLIIANPEIIAERGRRHEGTRRFDRLFGRLYAPMYVALPVVAGLDAVRFGWSPLGPECVCPGVALLILGNGLILWSMAVNRHLETTVRIQEDRAHVVVTTGPYRIVRHPFYVGMMLQLAAAPLVLGSAWAFVPAGAMALLLVTRTALEDRTLRRDLPGYEDYARRTRSRLLPGIW